MGCLALIQGIFPTEGSNLCHLHCRQILYDCAIWDAHHMCLTASESPLDCKAIQPVHPKGYQSWILIGRTDAETPILGLPDVKNWLIGKDPDAGKDWVQEEKGATEDEMVGWHHRLNGHEFEQASGVGDGQGGLVCCSPWGWKELEMTEWLNWTELNCKMLDLFPVLLVCTTYYHSLFILRIVVPILPHMFSLLLSLSTHIHFLCV